eukprot:Rhum_TRINITY_DN13430_c0_g1::Rhum_TRINITY_DN13430_c0_g1_i1::g.60226::m.60226
MAVDTAAKRTPRSRSVDRDAMSPMNRKASAAATDDSFAAAPKRSSSKGRAADAATPGGARSLKAASCLSPKGRPPTGGSRRPPPPPPLASPASPAAPRRPVAALSPRADGAPAAFPPKSPLPSSRAPARAKASPRAPPAPTAPSLMSIYKVALVVEAKKSAAPAAPAAASVDETPPESASDNGDEPTPRSVVASPPTPSAAPKTPKSKGRAAMRPPPLPTDPSVLRGLRMLLDAAGALAPARKAGATSKPPPKRASSGILSPKKGTSPKKPVTKRRAAKESHPKLMKLKATASCDDESPDGEGSPFGGDSFHSASGADSEVSDGGTPLAEEAPVPEKPQLKSCFSERTLVPRCCPLQTLPTQHHHVAKILEACVKSPHSLARAVNALHNADYTFSSAELLLKKRKVKIIHDAAAPAAAAAK